jgi:lipoprotein-anchoring transpeptidase ErfK/SrfK
MAARNGLSTRSTFSEKRELDFMARWIDVSISKHQLRLFDRHRLIKTYPIAVGKMLTSTPTGTFTIINKQSNPGGPFGVLWMGLSKPHYGIHGTNNPASIGKNVSHGCIRMFNHDVLELSRSVPIGTQVFIHK